MGLSGLYPFHTSTLYRICDLQGTLYPTLHGSIAPYILPCTLYPIPCPIQVYSTLHYTLYPIPCTLVYIGMWYPVPCTLVCTTACIGLQYPTPRPVPWSINTINPHGTFTVGAVGIGQKKALQVSSPAGRVVNGV